MLSDVAERVVPADLVLPLTRGKQGRVGGGGDAGFDRNAGQRLLMLAREARHPGSHVIPVEQDVLAVEFRHSKQKELLVCHSAKECTKPLELGIEGFGRGVGGTVWEIVEDGLEMVF